MSQPLRISDFTYISVGIGIDLLEEMLKIPFPSALLPITRSPLPTSYLLFPIPYYHLQLHPQADRMISTGNGKRKR